MPVAPGNSALGQESEAMDRSLGPTVDSVVRQVPGKERTEEIAYVPEDLPLPQRTVDWTPRGLVLRELGNPVALPLDGKNYPSRRLVVEVGTGDGTCRLVVDAGEVRVNGISYRAGESCAILAGAEVTWEGTAGIRLEDPRSIDRVQGSG
jgi:hypothetical protein